MRINVSHEELAEIYRIKEGLVALAAERDALRLRLERIVDRCIGAGKWFIPEDQHGTFAEEVRHAALALDAGREGSAASV